MTNVYKDLLQLYHQERIVKISDKKDFEDSGFDGTKPTKIIIHGFIDTGFETWVKVQQIIKYYG